MKVPLRWDSIVFSKFLDLRENSEVIFSDQKSFVAINVAVLRFLSCHRKGTITVDKSPKR